MQGDPGDESVEVLGADGEVARVVSRRQMRDQNLRHRNVAVVVQRSNGLVVAHQRSDWKDVHPSLWDVAFGGVPNVGETDEAAAVRELAEEAGLIIDIDDLVDLGGGTHDDQYTRWTGRFFMVTTDAGLVPADGEVAQMMEVSAAELPAWVAEHPVCPDVMSLLALVSERLS